MFGLRQPVRVRLTALYAFVLIVSGAVLLLITIGLVAGFRRSSSAAASGAAPAPGQGISSGVHSASSSGGIGLHTVAIMAAIALAIVAAASIWLAWALAGRVLRPLSNITASVREMSATNLDQRLAYEGPSDELKELADTFDALLDRLEAAFRSQRRFVANASHELRTPLARLKALVQVAIADPEADAESLRTAHERVLVSEQQLEQLIDALLTLAAGEQSPARREPVDLDQTAQQALEAHRDDIARSSLHLNSSLGGARVTGDPRLVDRLVENLIDNAVRHNEQRGWIDVSTSAGDGDAVIIVANGGLPIGAEEAERLAQPFQRGDERTRHGRGHGLGLSIVHAIATAHGATVTTTAPSEGGLSVEVRFPADLPCSGGGE
jgi:signal transduction histidine kinase